MPFPIGNLFMKGIINSPLHPILGSRFAIINFKGIKSGKKYSTPVNVVVMDGVLSTISLQKRTWWRNLRGGAIAFLRRNGSTAQVRAEVIETPAQVAASLDAYFHQFPGDARYFKIHLDPDGKPDPHEFARISGDHVLIRYHPV